MNRALLLLLLSIAASGADAICGDWVTGDGKAHVRIAPAADGASDEGVIVWLQSPNGDDGKPRLDVNNSDESRRATPVMGLKIVSGLAKDDDQWSGGRVYDPVGGKTYKCKATLAGDGKTLKLRGYIGFSLLGRTDTWTRLPPATPEIAPKP